METGNVSRRQKEKTTARAIDEFSTLRKIPHPEVVYSWPRNKKCTIVHMFAIITFAVIHIR